MATQVDTPVVSDENTKTIVTDVKVDRGGEQTAVGQVVTTIKRNNTTNPATYEISFGLWIEDVGSVAEAKDIAADIVAHFNTPTNGVLDQLDTL